MAKCIITQPTLRDRLSILVFLRQPKLQGPKYTWWENMRYSTNKLAYGGPVYCLAEMY